MKLLIKSVSLMLLLSFAVAGFSFPQATTTTETPRDQSAKEDVKDAGRDAKNAAKKTGRAVKKTAKKGTHKAAKKTRQGAEKIEESTR
ncbi:MAG: hypothetical protein HYX72_06965 [Acidobacteria bacterium]|nr:hypothetical protein [Acidobacteriota bacterium]